MDKVPARSDHGAPPRALFFRTELDAGRLVQPVRLVLRDERDYWLTDPSARRSSPKIQAFRDWLLDQAAREPEVIADPS